MHTVTDLFCGAGIGAMGFKNIFDINYAVDNNQYAVDTYIKNIKFNAVCKDIRKLKSSDIPDSDVIIGGFPCKPFSVAGSGKGVKDKKNGDLSLQFMRIVNDKKPKAFIIENVAGLVSKKHHDFFYFLIQSFENMGYIVNFKLVNLANYGIPQDRKRVFIVGVHNEDFEFPSILPKKTLFEAIHNLPIPDKKYEAFNHYEYYDGGFSPRYVSRNRQRQWNEQSFTIVSCARQLPLYPTPANYDIRKTQINPPRRFTVRECLRIQSVPDSFCFDIRVPLLKQYERCSGIPSLFAENLAKQVEKCL